MLCLKDENVHYVADYLYSPLQNHQSRQGDVSDVLAVHILEQFSLMLIMLIKHTVTVANHIRLEGPQCSEEIGMT